MNDGARVYPVNKLVMHHAVSDEMVNWSDLDVQDWFSNTGKARAYQNGAIDSLHEHPSRPGVQTYSQAHFCLHKYTVDGNKYGWRLTELIKDPFSQVAWHAGNWPVNQQSIGIETAGDYRDHDIDIKALMLVADQLGRPWDQELGGQLEVYGHKDFYATECPAQIYNHIGDLIDMINNPDKWNSNLFPAPVPQPAPAPAPQWDTNGFPKTLWANEDLNVVNLDTNQVQGAVIPKGTRIDFASMKAQNNTVYYRSTYSHNKDLNWGIDINRLTDVDPTPKPQPIPEQVPAPKLEPTPAPVEQPSDIDKENNSLLKQILAKINDLFTWLSNIFKRN